MSTRNPPSEPINIRRRLWRAGVGANVEQFQAALDAFYKDIRDSFRLAMQNQQRNFKKLDLDAVLDEVDDYVANHYF